MNEPRRIRLSVIAAFAIAIAAAWLGRQALGIDWSLDEIQALVADLGTWGPVVFVLLLTFRSILLIPSQVILIAAGLCFGTLAGAAYGAVGLTLSGLLAFFAAHWLGREAVLARVPPRLRLLLDGAGWKTTGTVLFLGTAYPFGPVHAYPAGAALAGAPVPLVVATLAPGAVIRAALFTWFGSQLADGDLATTLTAAAAIVALLAAPFLLPGVRRWLWRLLSGGAPEPPAGP